MMTPQLIIEKPFRVVCMKISTNVSIECIDAAPLVMWNIDFGAVRVFVSEAKLRIGVALKWIPVIERGRCWIVIMASEEAGWYP
jgi:hypothetical protein